MTIEIVRNALLWCTILNGGVLLLWGLLLVLPHDWLNKLAARCLRISDERFEAINYASIVFFKLAIILFNLVPYIALRIAG